MENLTREMEEWVLEKSVKNMVNFYRKALINLKKGKFSKDSVPLGIRKKFIDYGIIRKFGNKFELTKMGAQVI